MTMVLEDPGTTVAVLAVRPRESIADGALTSTNPLPLPAVAGVAVGGLPIPTPLYAAQPVRFALDTPSTMLIRLVLAPLPMLWGKLCTVDRRSCFALRCSADAGEVRKSKSSKLPLL